jgi:hypothetical protein
MTASHSEAEVSLEFSAPTVLHTDFTICLAPKPRLNLPGILLTESEFEELIGTFARHFFPLDEISTTMIARSTSLHAGLVICIHFESIEKISFTKSYFEATPLFERTNSNVYHIREYSSSKFH